MKIITMALTSMLVLAACVIYGGTGWVMPQIDKYRVIGDCVNSSSKNVKRADAESGKGDVERKVSMWKIKVYNINQLLKAKTPKWDRIEKTVNECNGIRNIIYTKRCPNAPMATRLPVVQMPNR